MSDLIVEQNNNKHELSMVVIPLLKGVVYQEESPAIWEQLLLHQGDVRSYVAVLGLELVIDEAERYAFLRSLSVAEDNEQSELPRLVTRRQLGYPVSLLLALLRKKLAESDAGSGEQRLILTREQILEMVRIFLPDNTNEVRLIAQLDATVNKVVELGFLRRLRGVRHTYEVRRIIKAFVDAQWLAGFERELAVYRGVAQELMESGSE